MRPLAASVLSLLLLLTTPPLRAQSDASPLPPPPATVPLPAAPAPAPRLAPIHGMTAYGVPTAPPPAPGPELRAYRRPQPRSVGLAYALAVGATLAPLYTAGALPESTSDATMAVVMGAGVCWGPSLGFAYGRAWKTALLTGLAKSAVFGGALYLDNRTLPDDPEEGGHAYASVLASAAVFLWSVADILRLGGVVEHENIQADNRARQSVALVPYLHLSSRQSAAGVTARF